MRHAKYIDIQHKLHRIDKTLAQSLNEKRLDIAELNRACEKFKKLLEHRPSLKNASYVVYSKYMTTHHNEEIFVFLDNKGDTVDNVHGYEFTLYGMIKLCEALESKVSKKF